jgi:hypothetical protein
MDEQSCHVIWTLHCAYWSLQSFLSCPATIGTMYEFNVDCGHASQVIYAATHPKGKRDIAGGPAAHLHSAFICGVGWPHFSTSPGMYTFTSASLSLQQQQH